MSYCGLTWQYLKESGQDDSASRHSWNGDTLSYLLSLALHQDVVVPQRPSVSDSDLISSCWSCARRPERELGGSTGVAHRVVKG